MANTQTRTEKKIRVAGFAGVCLAGLTLLQSFLPFFAGYSPGTLVSFIINTRMEALGKPLSDTESSRLYLITNLAGIVLVVVLAIGTFKKNKWCALLLNIYCIIALLASIPTAIILLGIPALLFLAVLEYFLFKGMLATFSYEHETGQIEKHS
jgi:hypothetical protein